VRWSENAGLTVRVRLQKIQYAKGKSDTIAKLDGTYRMPVIVGTEAKSTDIQQAIFGAPPSSLPAPLPASAPKAAEVAQTNGDPNVDGGEEEVKGVKRTREEESDDEGVAMEEDSDAPMEASSDEDD